MKTKTIAIALMFVLCLGLVTAVNVISLVPTPTDAPNSAGSSDAGRSNGNQAQSINGAGSSTSTSKKSGGGALLTKLVWDGDKCVKAPVLSRPYRIGSNSRMIVPHILVKTNEDGSKIVQRIFAARYTIAWNPETRRIDKSGTCDPSLKAETYQMLEIDWWKYAHTNNYKEVI